MKFIDKIALSAVLFMFMLIPAFAGLHLYQEPISQCPPRSFFEHYGSNTYAVTMFYPEFNIKDYFVKYQLPGIPDEYFNYSASKLSFYSTFNTNADTSIIFINIDNLSAPAYLIYKNKVKCFYKSDFYSVIDSSRLKSSYFYLLGYVIDSNRVLLALKANTSKGNLLMYNPEKDSLSLNTLKMYCPDYNDSVFVNTVIPTRLPPADIFKRAGDGSLYAKAFGYNYSKALETNNSEIITNTPKDYVLIRYDETDSKIKCVAPFYPVSRDCNADSSEKNRFIEGVWNYGYYWVSAYYDTSYKKYIDSLHVFDNRNDSLYEYNINDIAYYKRDKIANFGIGNDGTILLSNNHNVLYIRTPDGNLREERKLTDYFQASGYDTSTYVPNMTMDSSGIIYLVLNHTRSLFEFTPDGQFTEMFTGQECTANEHLDYFVSDGTGSYFKIYEDGTDKYLMSGVNQKYCLMLLDLNYYKYLSADQPKFSELSLGKIYPNPVSDVMNIDVYSSNDMFGAVSSLKIFDTRGAEVMDLSSQLSFSSGHYFVNANVENLPAGSYMVVAENARYKVIRKVIKE